MLDSLDTLEYVVTTGLGTPVVTQTIRARRHRQRRHVGAVFPVCRHRRTPRRTSSSVGLGRSRP
jgi:hypothetical protein